MVAAVLILCITLVYVLERSVRTMFQLFHVLQLAYVSRDNPQ